MSSVSNGRHWFSFFTCPRCGHYQRHAQLNTKGWRSYYWCPECLSYFRLKNGLLVGLAWGVIIAAVASLAMFAIQSYSGAQWPFGMSLLIGDIVAVPILIAIWPRFVRRIFRYEYVGKNAP